MINHIGFIDFENITKIDLEKINGKTKLIIVVGSKQTRKAAVYSHEAIDRASSVELIKVKGQGANALDFYIAYYLGKLINQSINVKYSIFSNDKGYDPLVEHLSEEGINIKRVSMESKSKTTKGKTAVRKTTESKKTGISPYEKALKKITEMPGKNRPKKMIRLRAYIKTALGNRNTDKEIDAIISELVEKKKISINGEKVKLNID
ncbi:MAG: hypothetical protein JW969_14885 [Spirochaetales bacterium]|nr:hypothetical protein [Spirochaetales bacterium]